MKHVIYHDHCADGFASAFAAWLALGDTDTRYIPMPNSPRTVPEGIGPDDEVWVLDYSFSRADLLALNARVKRLVVIDHHESMRAEIADLPFVIFDLEHSGCTMAWRHFHHDNLVPASFLALEHRDLGRMWDGVELMEKPAGFNEGYSRGLNNENVAAIHAALMMSTARTFPDWEMFIGLTPYLINVGTPLVKQEQALVRQACSNVHSMRIETRPHSGVPAVNSSMLQSEIGHELLSRFPDAPFVIIYFAGVSYGAVQWQYSLRGRKGGVDLSKIAVAYGGGGHPQAAGFTLSFLLPTNVLPTGGLNE